MTKMADPPVRLSSSQVTLILQRAAEIDARGDTLTVEELRRIANEAGIDPTATSTAIQEVLADSDAAPAEEAPAPEASSGTSPVASQMWIVSGGAVGVALGFLTAMGEPTRPLAIGGALVYLVLRAVHGMKLGKQLEFQLQNFVLWLGAAVGSLASEMFYTEEVLLVTFIAWFMTSVLGGLLIQFGPREKEEGQAAPKEPGPAQIGSAQEEPARLGTAHITPEQVTPAPIAPPGVEPPPERS